MNTRSAKNKGQRLQKEVVMKLRETFNFDNDEEDCFNGDIQARQMGGQGIDVILSSAAKIKIPFDVECKNTEKLNIWSAIEQSEVNSKKDRIPLVVFKRNRTKTYAVLELDILLNLLKDKSN